MWARVTVVAGLCPACCHENEDLAHLWWNCKAEQYAHIREKVPQNTTVEAMHPAYRDMMLAQNNTQLLDRERNNSTNEIRAVAAAEKLRSRVEDARIRDDGSKMSAGKAAEELGGYLCEGRLQVWTDGSCLDPRWEAIARAGAGVYFSEGSKLNMHFSIKARIDQTSVRGEPEAATCAILALDMPTAIHTDCEWVEKGIKEILNSMAKGETPSKREHPEVWALVEERAKSLPAGWLEVEHVPGHATEQMVMRGKLWRNTHNQVDLLAKQRAASGSRNPRRTRPPRGHRTAGGARPWGHG